MKLHERDVALLRRLEPHGLNGRLLGLSDRVLYLEARGLVRVNGPRFHGAGLVIITDAGRRAVVQS